MPIPAQNEPAYRDHQAWLGYLQPDGLVVSAQALVDAQAVIDRAGLAELQERFTAHVREIPVGDDDTVQAITEFPEFSYRFLGWPMDLVYGVDPRRPVPDDLTVALPEFGETLTATCAVHDNRATARPWLLLVKVLPPRTDLDTPTAEHDRGWHASPTAKFERLLRETRVATGLLTNGTQFRLIHAPRGENSGRITFPVAYMTSIPGRLILGAFHLLLGQWTLFGAPSDGRLPALLQRSRDYQSNVSTTLANQVLDSLYELLRGFQAANERARGELLREVLARHPDDIYGGLLNVLLRLVFLLFAEDRGLMPGSALYVRHYSVHGLFERLRSDAERYPDTMDHRYGAWAQLLALFRAIHGGSKHPQLHTPARSGYLFDPDRFPFLEGRSSRRQSAQTSPSPPAAGGEGRGEVGSANFQPSSPTNQLPLVSDGTLYRVLDKLLILDGERLSYRTLYVEEIGSVYQTIMGFRLEIAGGTSIAIKGRAKKDAVPAPTVINLESLLERKPAERAKWLLEQTEQKFEGKQADDLKQAASLDDLLAALDKRIARNATPHPVPKGGLVLQPTDERRRSGSHYTPRSFTEPIVRKTLEPILRRLSEQAQRGKSETRNPKSETSPKPETRIQPDTAATPAPSPLNGERAGVRGEKLQARSSETAAPPHPSPFPPSRGGEGGTSAAVPTPAALLSLKLCDLAVGSAAFLVEACRQLAEELIKAWAVHGGRPPIPPDEDEVLLARRLIAQHCLYGVDRNPMAVDLAKLSLWLATLAKDHPFTFLDHAIRCGDSLVGLTRQQIEDFTWGPPTGHRLLFSDDVRKRTAAALRERQALLALGDDYTSPQLKREKLEKADENLDYVRFIGDAVITAYFSADKDKAREQKRLEFAERCADRDLRRRPIAEVKALRGEPNPFNPQSAIRNPHSITPFHWEIEFPEVFERENPGFDAFVGNPPFVGGRRVRGALGDLYFDWLQQVHAESSGNADLVAHFYRRAFNFVRDTGCLGLIATKTIGQGDTRATGLRWICTHGGTIYAAHKRTKWPGQAAVVVSVVWITKGTPTGPFEIDDRPVPSITAYLFHTGGHDNPTVLRTNADKSYVGSYVLGMGFTFDDTDSSGTANPLSLMREVIARNPANEKRIFPYIGGEEVNEHPRHEHHRYVINFADFPLRRCELEESWEDATEKQRAAWLRAGIVPLDYPSAVAADWPDLVGIVEEKVKPERTRKKPDGSFALRDPLPQRWWHFADKRPALSAALALTPRALVIPQVTQWVNFTFMGSEIVFSHRLIVFPFSSDAFFAVLQSNCHEAWARFYSYSLEERFAYGPSDCFETFPFPAGWETNAALEAEGRSGEDLGTVRPGDLAKGASSPSHQVAKSPSPSVMELLEEAGRAYYEFRAALMMDFWLGLTETYNLFHSPDGEALARLEAIYAKRAAKPGWRTEAKVPAEYAPFTVYPTPAAALAGIRHLRDLHAAMDAAVLTAYGWPDLLPQCQCEFLLDYEEEDEGTGGSGDAETLRPGALATGASSPSPRVSKSQSRRKKPWRYRWPDVVRDEVLARLLKLNAERAEEEQLAGMAAAATAPAKAKRKKAGKAKASGDAMPVQDELLPPPQQEIFG